MTTYAISWSDGRTETHETYQDARAAVETALDDAVVGHAGDISEGGERTLFWASEEDAANDDGARAAGSIREVT